MVTNAGQAVRQGIGIKVKVLAFLATSMALIFAIGTFLNALQQTHERYALFQERSLLFVQSQADALMAALWNVDDAVVNQQLESLKRDPTFLGARVVDPDGKELYKLGNLERADALVAASNIIHEKEKLGQIAIHFSPDTIITAIHRGIIESILFSLVTFVIVLATVYVGLQMILKPMGQMKLAMTDLASGRLDAEVPALERRDEVGAMARAIQVFKDNAIRMEELTRLEKARQDEKDRRAFVVAEAVREFDGKVTGVLREVTTATDNLDVAAQTMTASAEQTGSRADAVVAAAHQSSESAQTVAAAAEELTASVQEIGRQVVTSSSISLNAVQNANRANDMVLGLADAAEKIGAVVKLINSIAAKSNLLALNATIEAARAGAAGKGFGVVANEVKSLARQTAEATGEIAAHVKAVQTATNDAVDVIGSIGRVIREISQIATTISAAVEEQGHAIQEIARSAHHAAIGSEDVTSHIRDVREVSDHSRQTAIEVFKASALMSFHLETLRSEVDGFLTIVRED
jgi:methyl-accepting chemotaxis protein